MSATLWVLQGKNACLHLPAGPARDSLTRTSLGLLTTPANPALINKPANWINKQLFLFFFFLTASWHAIKMCDKLSVTALPTAGREGVLGKISHFKPFLLLPAFLLRLLCYRILPHPWSSHFGYGPGQSCYGWRSIFGCPWWWILKPRHCGGMLKCRGSLWERKICLLPWQGTFGYEPVVLSHKILIKGGECDVVREQSVVMSAFSCPPLMPNSFGAFLEWMQRALQKLQECKQW